jgi:hypothetical protein
MVLSWFHSQVGPLASLAGVIASLSIILTFCHWKQLKKPYLALIKLLLIAACLFGMSTLPWQQNFAGLIGGIVFGMGLTFALVPFVNITKYNRKSKVRSVLVESFSRSPWNLPPDKPNLDVHPPAFDRVRGNVRHLLRFPNTLLFSGLLGSPSKRSLHQWTTRTLRQ